MSCIETAIDGIKIINDYIKMLIGLTAKR